MRLSRVAILGRGGSAVLAGRRGESGPWLVVGVSSSREQSGVVCGCQKCDGFGQMDCQSQAWAVAVEGKIWRNNKEGCELGKEGDGLKGSAFLTV